MTQRDGPVANGAFDWAGLADLLTDPAAFRALWKDDRYEVERLWAALEDNSTFRVKLAYGDAVAQAAFGLGGGADVTVVQTGLDLEYGSGLAALFLAVGYRGAAEVLARRRLAGCRASGDRRKLQAALGELATLTCDPGEQWDLINERHRLCLDIDDSAALASCLGALAETLQYRLLCAGDTKPAADSDADVTTETSAEIKELLSRMRRLCAATNDRNGLREWTDIQARILWLDNWSAAAAGLYQRYLHLCCEAGDLAGQINAHGMLAYLREQEKAHDEALGHLEAAEGLARELGRFGHLARILADKGVLLIGLGDTHAGFAAFLERAEVLSRIGLAADIKKRLQHAMWADRSPERQRTMAFATVMERLARRLGDDDALQCALGSQAEALNTTGEVRRALSLFDRQGRLCRGRGDREGLARNLKRRAELLAATHPEAALVLLEQRLAVCEELEDPAAMSQALGARAAILRDRGRSEEALQALRRQEVVGEQPGVYDSRQALGGQREVLKSQMEVCGDDERGLALAEELERVCGRLWDVAGVAEARCRQAELRRRLLREGLLSVELRPGQLAL